MKKISNILLYIFAVGIIICLFAGTLSLLGYIIAIIIGGETATNLCLFIFKTYFPLIIKVTSIITGIGLLGMYFSKQKSLTIVSSDKKE